MLQPLVIFYLKNNNFRNSIFLMLFNTVTSRLRFVLLRYVREASRTLLAIHYLYQSWFNAESVGGRFFALITFLRRTATWRRCQRGLKKCREVATPDPTISGYFPRGNIVIHIYLQIHNAASIYSKHPFELDCSRERHRVVSTRQKDGVMTGVAI